MIILNNRLMKQQKKIKNKKIKNTSMQNFSLLLNRLCLVVMVNSGH